MNYFSKGVKETIKRALKEDIGRQDITTAMVIPKGKRVKGILLAKQNCVICGLNIAAGIFKDKRVNFKPLVSEGQKIKKGKVIANISGKARGILTAERVALNFLSLLSGIATETRRYVDAVRPYKTRILDTRKTLPGLRELEKYAVRIGGGHNHRMGLDEMVLVKDNHLKVLGDRLWVEGLKEIRKKIGSGIQVEVEVKTLREFKDALKIEPEIILLDNMSVKGMRQAVKIRNSLASGTLPVRRAGYRLSPKLEASGGIDLCNVRRIAATGVDMVSIGALTHSVRAIDLSLEIL
ncbi:MAG: carboxylating nicotinate-nucleotide diphosphorylase [Candidatus Omnitrophica bacterium]|nr:carboxylating nicotinate-nucleotide diphosphorylase [Candidatus Omnitrophota bacterium]MDD5553479.1 carboxylating nicotinate-nucleotide diphosphorylase [Candidatus Omnitrophota bacterium]